MKLDAWLSLLEQRHPQAIDLGLERCGSVYERMGSPRPAKRVYTVAGTNGKGSTVAFIAAMCGSLGQTYGALVSPHIFRFNERVSIMGKPVSDDCLVQAFERVEQARNEVSLTYFEFTTLAGLSILNRSDLDFAVLEVGLGGRLDAVNIVDADCAVITPIGLDHQEYLGHDLHSIATEKAGILRPGRPVVCTQPNPPAPIIQAADNLMAPLAKRGTDFDLVQYPGSEEGLLEFTMGEQSMLVSPPAMAGKHQLDNLAAAMAALVMLNPDCMSKARSISTAIQACTVAGRLQKVSSSPEIILDVGHNGLAASALAAYLEDKDQSNSFCVVSMLADKPAERVAASMGHVCNRWFCADSPGPRGQTGKRLGERLMTVLPGAQVSVFGPLGDAIKAALSAAGKRDRILVFGSFSTVSVAVDWLKNSLQHDAHDADRITPEASAEEFQEKPYG